jgi:hypothetical protein
MVTSFWDTPTVNAHIFPAIRTILFFLIVHPFGSYYLEKFCFPRRISALPFVSLVFSSCSFVVKMLVFLFVAFASGVYPERSERAVNRFLVVAALLRAYFPLLYS